MTKLLTAIMCLCIVCTANIANSQEQLIGGKPAREVRVLPDGSREVIERFSTIPPGAGVTQQELDEWFTPPTGYQPPQGFGLVRLPDDPGYRKFALEVNPSIIDDGRAPNGWGLYPLSQQQQSAIYQSRKLPASKGNQVIRRQIQSFSAPAYRSRYPSVVSQRQCVLPGR